MVRSRAPWRCFYCNEAVDSRDPDVYYEHTGWALRRAKGLHALRLRKCTGHVAHYLCVEKEACGTQDSLFGEPRSAPPRTPPPCQAGDP